MEAKKRAASGLPPQTESPSNPLWMYASGVLFVLLLISMFSKKRSAKDEDEVPVKPINKEAA